MNELIVGENLSIRVVLKLHILNTTRPRMNVPIHWFGVDGRPFPVKINNYVVSKISGFVRSGLASEPQTFLHFLNSADPTIAEHGTGYTTETHFSIAFEGFNVKGGILVVVVVVVLRKKEI